MIHTGKLIRFWLRITYMLLPVLLPDTISAQPTRPSPNIIFILTDDQRYDAMGFAGNQIIHTPNMDKLARQGIFFKNAFVTTPICAASRASIATGLYERTHQFTFNTPPLKKEIINSTYYKKIKENGYYTGFLGKFGMQFEEGEEKNLFDVFDAYMPDFYYRLTGAGWSTHTYLTSLTGNKALDFIKNAPDDQPFCLNISFNAPHAEDRSPDQYIYPEKLQDLYADVEIPPAPISEEKYFLDQPEFVRNGMNRIRWYWRFDKPEKYQRMVKGYYRMITAVDEVLGDIRATLDSMNLAENTIIIFTSDNGYFLGERGMAGKWLMYENSIRVPFIIYDPTRFASPQEREEIILNIDIAPTLIEMAGLLPGPELQGMSVVPLLENSDTRWRNEFFIEHLYDIEYIPKSEGIRTEKWKYFRYIDHPEHEELYDLDNDPLEINNLAREAGEKMTGIMRQKCYESKQFYLERKNDFK
jgi:arylsulfatase A-like enzyme